MRALLGAATIVLSATAAHSQEFKSAGSTARAVVPAAAMPSSTIVEQLKAAGELKDPKDLDAPAPKLEAVEAKPADAKPAAQPVIAKPAEAKSVETRPAEPKAVAAKPAESTPVQATDARLAKKRVVRKRETDEQKARRIAAKYGVYW